ncbi:MAG: divalent metal cation transporter, partial [Deltaproteobacteria bacterium]
MSGVSDQQGPLFRLTATMAIVGPGLAIAATGVGAGDLVAAAAAGSRYGLAVAWAALAGAALKFILNEGLARWQLATGTTLLEGWSRHLGRPVQYLFLAYLIVWSFVVGGALISACGMAAHSLVPACSVGTWGIVHSLAAAALVLASGYRTFENLMKWFIAVMFVALVGSALWAAPYDVSGGALASAAVPRGGIGYLLGVIGGVGGSVTLLSYGYWIRERRWEGLERLRTVRTDLGVAYLLTALFGMAVIVLAARSLHARGVVVAGNEAVTHMAA